MNTILRKHLPMRMGARRELCGEETIENGGVDPPQEKHLVPDNNPTILS